MRYRLIKKEDIRKIFLLGRSNFGSKSEYSWDWSISEIKQYLKKSFGFGIVCIKNGSIIGFILVEKNYSSQKTKCCMAHLYFSRQKIRAP